MSEGEGGEEGGKRFLVAVCSLCVCVICVMSVCVVCV